MSDMGTLKLRNCDDGGEAFVHIASRGHFAQKRASSFLRLSIYSSAFAWPAFKRLCLTA